MGYRICPRYLDKQAWAKSEDPDQMPQNAVSDQGLHCLQLTQQFKGTKTSSKIVLGQPDLSKQSRPRYDAATSGS